MNVRYAKRFLKDIDKLKEEQVVKREILNIITTLKNAENLAGIPNIKPLKGYSQYFRIKVGDYRLGFKKTEESLDLIRFLHRKDIYRLFP
ncbi:type II toxin-antitoxin system RelE family toxin [Desulfonatronum thiodismutans]|uniref:type II toxin-antitoxin system RelE family toxin n=1 Tax=Desulfonatronum thiodismutans TaxID=159290 RepID=UPI0004ABEE70